MKAMIARNRAAAIAIVLAPGAYSESLVLIAWRILNRWGASHDC